MPINMSPILLRVLKLVFMKLLGSTSLLVATCFSFIILILVAILDVEIFTDIPKNIALDSRHGVSSILPSSNINGGRTLSSVQVNKLKLNEVETLSGTEWSAQHYVDVFSSGPDCFEKPLLLILVTSAPENSKRRTAIRNTWARYRDHTSLNNTHFKTVFLIGRTFPTLARIVEWELEKHEDILLGNYQDSYRNLTLKVQHGMMWAAESCQAQYLLKTDDDCFVNTKLLVEFLQKYNRQTSNLYVGHKMRSQEVVRNSMNKWYVSLTDYPRKEYPPYASGTGYMLSLDVVKRVVARSPFHHPFPVEDAYLGVVAKDLGVPLLDSPRFALFSTKWSMCNYLYFFVVHDLSPEQQYLCLRYADASEKICQGGAELHQWE